MAITQVPRQVFRNSLMVLHFAVFLLLLNGGIVDASEQCDEGSDGVCPHAQESPGPSISEHVQFLADGINGSPKMTYILKFPKYKEDGAFFNIVHKISGHFRHFGILLLNDNGGRVGILETKYKGDPEPITTEILTLWVNGVGLPRTWGTLAKCLRDVGLNTIAEDIEEFFKTQSPTLSQNKGLNAIAEDIDEFFKTQSPTLPQNKVFHFLNIKDELSHVSELLHQVHESVEAIRESNLTLAETKVQEISHDILSIINRLLAGKVRVGIVGLTKAGKSTLLNALLGKQFLPSSIQPQTANEVVIAHDMSTPEGELYCEKTKGEKPYPMASGVKKVYEELLKLNTFKRAGTETVGCHKVILHAPLNFLTTRGIKEIELELSDTPGLGEAGVKGITADAEIAVKEMCAFILILNSRYMKTESEAKLLNKLSVLHPELFSKLNRVITLVNAYDIFYSEEKSASIKPYELPTYVSDYLREPEVLGKYIPPERIVPLSALWALRARRWENASVLMSDSDATTLYKEAMLMLRYIGQEDKANSLENEMNPENVDTAVSILEPFSQIEKVEQIITDMVVKQGGRVLVESAVDDTVAVITDRLLPAIRELVADEALETKQDSVTSFEELDRIFQSTSNEYLMVFDKLHISLTSATTAQVSALRNALGKSLNSVITTKLMDDLKGSYELEDKNQVITQMQSTRDSIPKAALTSMNTDWFTVSDAVRKAAAEQVKRVLSNFRADFLPALSKANKGSQNPDLNELVDDLSTSISRALNALSDGSASFLPDSIPLALIELPLTGPGSEGVQDELLSSHIDSGMKKSFKSESKRDCDDGIIFGWGKKCFHYTEVTYFNQVVYSPKFNSLQTSFASVVEGWMTLFNEQVGIYLKQLSETVAGQSKARLLGILEVPIQIVQDKLETSRVTLSNSEENVSRLDQKKYELIELKNKLRKILK